MTEWSEHVHRFAKKKKMTYREASMDPRCKKEYEKSKIVFRKSSPTRKKKRMNVYTGTGDPKYRVINSKKTIPGAAAAIYEMAVASGDYNIKPEEARRAMLDAGYHERSINKIMGLIKTYETDYQKFKEREDLGKITRGKIMREQNRILANKYFKMKEENDPKILGYRIIKQKSTSGAARGASGARGASAARAEMAARAARIGQIYTAKVAWHEGRGEWLAASADRERAKKAGYTVEAGQLYIDAHEAGESEDDFESFLKSAGLSV